MCQNLDLWFLTFITFCQKNFSTPFLLFWLSVLLSFLFFLFGFLSPFVFSSFSLLFCTCFLARVVSSLTYPNLVRNKRLWLLLLYRTCWIIYSSHSSLYSNEEEPTPSNSRYSCTFLAKRKWDSETVELI
jgi:hypothetical protein